MKEMQRVKGYSHPDAAHTSPISSIRQLEDKQPKQESLIQKCMKSLIKEKMSGSLINAARKRRHQQQNNHSPSPNKLGSLSFLSLTRFLNGSIRRTRYHGPENLTPTSGANDKHSRHQSTLASINQKITKISQFRNGLSLLQVNKAATELIKKKKSVPIEANTTKNIEMSFISAIEHSCEGDSNLTPGFNAQVQPKIEASGTSVRLPEIKSKFSINSLVSPTSIVKGLLKKSADYNIHPIFWKFLTSPLEAKQRARKHSTSINDLNLPAIPNSKQIKSSLFKPTIPSSSRELFLNYVADLPTPFYRLIQFVLSFFDVRIPQELSALFYSSLLQEIKMVNERAWSIIAFVFWDFNRDGIINSSDIFAIFKELNNFDDQSPNENINVFQKHAASEKQKPRKTIRHEKNAHRQIMSSTEDIVNALKQFKPKEQIQPKNQQRQGEKKERVSLKKVIMSLENIQKALRDFKEQLSGLNHKLAPTQFKSINIEDLKSPQDVPIPYLEQIVLTQPTLKYKQVLPLLSAGAGTGSEAQNLEIFPKDLHVKVCSSYQRCFISTEHNEATRMGRQKIEEHKQELKNRRQKKNKMLEQKAKQNIKIGKQLGYVKVAESEMGQKMKEIVLSLLGCVE